jgi:hypothetical protein
VQPLFFVKMFCGFYVVRKPSKKWIVPSITTIQANIALRPACSRCVIAVRDSQPEGFPVPLWNTFDWPARTRQDNRLERTQLAMLAGFAARCVRVAAGHWVDSSWRVGGEIVAIAGTAVGLGQVEVHFRGLPGVILLEAFGSCRASLLFFPLTVLLWAAEIVRTRRTIDAVSPPIVGSAL